MVCDIMLFVTAYMVHYPLYQPSLAFVCGTLTVPTKHLTGFLSLHVELTAVAELPTASTSL